jgi:hypothetical protein
MNLENLPTPICDREKFQSDEESDECVDLKTAQNLERKLILATKTLDDIIAGCCNPDVAIRRVMLELGPIRKTLKIIKS